MKPLKLAFLFGTRPEFIKLAPVIKTAQERGHQALVILTGQHQELITPLLKLFNLHADFNLEVMSPNQSLPELSRRILEKCAPILIDQRPDAVIVQGDTTSALMGAYCGFCLKIPVAHIEAGLRTGDLLSPFPEEGNRQLIGRIARLHFTPTKESEKNLKKENLSSGKNSIFVTGNTGIDALLMTLKHIQSKDSQPLENKLDQKITDFMKDHWVIALTAHRRESFGEGLKNVFQALLRALEKEPRAVCVFPVHPNPNVRELAQSMLKNHPRILMCDPLPYVAFIELLFRSRVILTDSGGVQEEAPSLKKPILVLREKTERPEGVKAGFAKLLGTNAKKIEHELLSSLRKHKIPKRTSPYGDGKASLKILKHLENKLKT